MTLNTHVVMWKGCPRKFLYSLSIKNTLHWFNKMQIMPRISTISFQRCFPIAMKKITYWYMLFTLLKGMKLKTLIYWPLHKCFILTKIKVRHLFSIFLGQHVCVCPNYDLKHCDKIKCQWNNKLSSINMSLKCGVSNFTLKFSWWQFEMQIFSQLS